MMDFPLNLTRENGNRPKVSWTAPNHFPTITSQYQLTLKLTPRIAKKLFPQRLFKDMVLQFSIDQSIRPLLSLS